MALNMRKDAEVGEWIRVPECDTCASTIYYAEAATWAFIAEDSGWAISARSGAVTCDRCADAEVSAALVAAKGGA